MKPLKLEEMKQVRAGNYQCSSDSDCPGDQSCYDTPIELFWGLIKIEMSTCW
jgi:hypothetical protein